MIAPLLLLTVFIAFGLPIAAIFVPWFLMTGNIMPLYRASMFTVRTGLRVAGISVEAEGLERVPFNTACIFMSNHVSNLDPPVLLPLIPGRTVVFLKQSLMKIPILGYCMRLADFIPVSRDGTAQSALESERMAQIVLAKGVHITTFVEGTRSWDGRLLPFKKGPFYLAMETGAPCVPITISGTQSLMSKGSSKIRPGRVRVTFHAPVYPIDVADRDVLMARVREAIASSLPESASG